MNLLPSASQVLVVLITLASTFAAVMLHYESGRFLSQLIEHSKRPHRQRILYLLFGLIAAHIASIWIFAVACWGLIAVGVNGEITGYSSFNLLDFVYLSSITYSTVGYGDLIPNGDIRFLLGTEALVGMTLITWTASLTFVEMQRHWQRD
jgi:Ion channel